MLTRREVVRGGSALGAVFPIGGCGNGTASYDALAARLRRPLPAIGPWDPLGLIRYAILAANSHNSQPWRFELARDRVRILPDPRFRLPAVDPDDHHLWCSLGCAAENLAVAARGMGREPHIGFDAAAGAVEILLEPARPRTDPLHAAVVRRQSTRLDYDGREPPAPLLAALLRQAPVGGVAIALGTAGPDRARIKDLVLTANRAQMEDPRFVAELRDWIRFDADEAIARRDGLSARVNGTMAAPRWLGQRLFGAFYTVDAETRKIAGWLDSSGGLALFAGPDARPESWVAVGRSFQRFALRVTAAGLRHAHVNMPVEVPRARAELARLFGLADRRPDLLIRFGYGPLAPWSLRRDAVLAAAAA